MILLKANAELKHTFERLIQTMGVPVEWNEIFVVLNNFLILPGEVRSLIFNFDNKKVNTNVIEIPIAEEAVQPVGKNVIANNVLDMILYVFGKWGKIKGLRVEKDYAQLNALFTEILRELKIEPGYRDDNFRFYKSGSRITYEDVVQAAMEAGTRKEEEPEEEEEQKLGLWHNVCWIMNTASFKKEEENPVEQDAERIGNNFYRIGYKCPNCGKHLHMVVYPVDKEFLIETEEGKVYLARAYACDSCNRFYTPRPGKLLGEGDVYLLDFEEDRDAYEDYQQLLGKRGEKTSNYKFNEYEWERNKKPAKESGNQEEEREDEVAQLDEMDLNELLRLEEKLDAGFYTLGKTGASYPLLKEKIRRKKEAYKVENHHSLDATPKTGREKAEKEKSSKEKPSQEKSLAEPSLQEKSERSQQEAEQLREKYDARMNVIERMSTRQMQELKESIKREKHLTEPEKRSYTDKIEQHIYQKKEKELKKRAEKARDGNYIQLSRAIEEIEKADVPKTMKEPILSPLYDLKEQKAQAEAEQLIANMPAVMDRKRYKLFQEKLKQYKEADITPYEEKLKERREQAERQEVEQLVKRAGKNDRRALFRVWERLQEPDFSKENTEKPLKEIHDRIRKLDEAAIDKICPDIMDMTFEEGVEAYEKISKGIFLPELKSNALEMIDKRLTKMKSDESELLVKKLKDELSGKLKDSSSLYFYEARKAMRGEWEGPGAAVVNCAMSVYAEDRNRYEFPVVVCDSTRKGTGKEGFLLTPDHLFYNSMFSCEGIPVLNIKSVFFSTGLINKGVYIHQKNGEKTKIPVGLPSKDWAVFTRILDEFIKYLQEKPESRKISYLAKEEHEVKCCFRCGHVYDGGNICPKCGNKANK